MAEAWWIGPKAVTMLINSCDNPILIFKGIKKNETLNNNTHKKRGSESREKKHEMDAFFYEARKWKLV